MSKITEILDEALAIQGLTEEYADADIQKKFARLTGINCFSVEELEDPENEEHIIWHIPTGQLYRGATAPVVDVPGVTTPEDLNDALTEGGDVKISEDLSPTNVLKVGATVSTVNLGGNTIKTAAAGSPENKYGDGLEVSDATVTIKNGVIDNIDSAPDGAAIMIKANSNVTLDNMKITTNGFPVYVNGAASVTIKSGEYVANNSTAAVYVAKPNGKATITGGYFKSMDYKGTNFCLNLKDELTKNGEDPRDFIEVKGGEYEGFDPSKSYGEPNAPVNFVADGYTVTSYEKDGKIIYKVVKE